MTGFEDDEGFATPEEAAWASMLSDIPARYVRLNKVVHHPDGRSTTVEFITNEEPYAYPYYVECSRHADGLWREDYSHN